MSWRQRLLFVAAFTVFGAATWAAQPYWDSMMRSADSDRGRRARRDRATDTVDRALGRASLGAAVGLGAAVLSFTLRNYRPGSGRRLHWTGLEIPDRRTKDDRRGPDGESH